MNVHEAIAAVQEAYSYKKGDRVRLISTKGLQRVTAHRCGDMGTVVDVTPTFASVMVQFDNSSEEPQWLSTIRFARLRVPQPTGKRVLSLDDEQ